MKSVLCCLIALSLSVSIAHGKQSAQGKSKPPFFNVMDLGVCNSSAALSAEAFRAAIQAAKLVGGGTVYVPAGNYVSGPIELISNLTLYIDAGAAIRFSATRLPLTPGRQQGVEVPTLVPLIGGHDLENVAITNCTVHHAHGAVTIGSETSGGVCNVVARSITAVDTENGIRIKSARGRGGVVQDVRFDNFTMEDADTKIIVTTYYVKRAEGPTAEEPISVRTPVFRNIAISDVTITHARNSAIDIEGLPGMPITELGLTDILDSGAVGLVAAHTGALDLHHTQLNPCRGPAFAIESASNLILNDVTSRKSAPGSPVIQLNECEGAILRNSRTFPGTGVFLSTKKGGYERSSSQSMRLQAPRRRPRNQAFPLGINERTLAAFPIFARQTRVHQMQLSNRKEPNNEAHHPLSRIRGTVLRSSFSAGNALDDHQSLA